MISNEAVYDGERLPRRNRFTFDYMALKHSQRNFHLFVDKPLFSTENKYPIKMKYRAPYKASLDFQFPPRRGGGLLPQQAGACISLSLSRHGVCAGRALTNGGHVTLWRHTPASARPGSANKGAPLKQSGLFNTIVRNWHDVILAVNFVRFYLSTSMEWLTEISLTTPFA